MKNLILSILVIMATACNEVEENTPVAPVKDDFDPMAMSVQLSREGMLMGVGHTVTGDVKVYDNSGALVLVLDPFSSQNGPDLKVYLSKDEKASDYINLGPLKSVNGKQSYDINGTPDLNQYKYVMIWCQEFSVLFGIAELKLP